MKPIIIFSSESFIKGDFLTRCFNLYNFEDFTRSFQQRNTLVVGYDEKGNVNSIRMYDSNGNINYNESPAYEFDDRGNWITCKSDAIIESEPQVLHFRTISYY